jgi:hypothetical protein
MKVCNGSRAVVQRALSSTPEPIGCGPQHGAGEEAEVLPLIFATRQQL